jgi:hypothetical protein
LNCEYGQNGFTGLGWTVAGAGGAGPVSFFTLGNDANSSWNKYWAGHSRLVGGLLSPAPDYIITNLGANDWNVATGTVTAAVTGYLTACRVAAPNAKIVLVTAYDGEGLAGVEAGFTAYQAATPDASAFIINLNIAGLFNTSLNTGAATPTAGSPDGVHLDYTLSGKVASLQMAAFKALFTSSAGGYSRSRVVNAI